MTDGYLSVKRLAANIGQIYICRNDISHAISAVRAIAKLHYGRLATGRLMRKMYACTATGQSRRSNVHRELIYRAHSPRQIAHDCSAR